LVTAAYTLDVVLLLSPNLLDVLPDILRIPLSRPDLPGISERANLAADVLLSLLVSVSAAQALLSNRSTASD
jgi:hypothetical protein